MTVPKHPKKTPSGSDPVLEELTSTGGGSGLEALEDLETDSGNVLPFDPASLEVDTRTYSVRDILSMLSKDQLQLLPEYQRRYGLWNDQRQSRLIESLLLRIPIPSLYFSEDDLGFYSVVDGVQRLSAIVHFVDPQAMRKHSRDLSPLRLKGLEYLTDYEGHTFDELPFSMQRRILDTPLLMHVIRRGTPEIVKFNVFERINTGGLPLSGQELRSALIGGQARQVLSDLADSPEFLAATGGSVSSERLADQELILRFFAFEQFWPWESFSHSVGQTLLNDTMHSMNRWSDMELQHKTYVFRCAMRNAMELFGRQAFRKINLETSRPAPINRALFEVESILCGQLEDRHRGYLEPLQNHVVRALADALKPSTEFWKAVSQSTGSVKAVNTRFAVMRSIFEEVGLALPGHICAVVSETDGKCRTWAPLTTAI